MPRLPDYDPLAVPASKDDIEAAATAVERGPLTVRGRALHGDGESVARMGSILRLLGRTERTTIDWSLLDGSQLTLDRSQFTVLVTEVQDAYSERLLAVHKGKRALKARLGEVTRRELAAFDWS